MPLPSPLSSPAILLLTSILLHLALLLYGIYQDAVSPIKYTDIDYHVFTSAASYLSRSLSPFARDTYRYTPLLAWLLYPTTWGGAAWFAWGKCLFSVGDVVAGWIIFSILRAKGMGMEKACRFSAIWLLNPMVVTISTRGSSEGLLGVVVMALLWAVLKRRVVFAGVLLGGAVHLKIYPFIYAVSILWWLDDGMEEGKSGNEGIVERVVRFVTRERVEFAVSSLMTFGVLNVAMYALYGFPFLEHSYLYHLARIDHRHNFSPYNTLLYLRSSPSLHANLTTSSISSPFPRLELERLAFIPQLLLSTILIPLALAKIDLPSTMLIQTLAFVTFNKVCTSQYFLWYLTFLPLHLPHSTLLSRPRTGLATLLLWVVGQAAWLQQGFELEFKGRSTFLPGLWASGMAFFAVNVWILGWMIGDVRKMGVEKRRVEEAKR